MRREFILPEEDVIFLDSHGFNWETINCGGMQWLLINDYPACDGYNISKVTVAIKIETGYPRTAIDMAYFYPPLSRTDGKPIGALSGQLIDGKSFQRWSRHRTSQNPWREGVDNISTHLSLVDFWFQQEFIKRPNGISA